MDFSFGVWTGTVDEQEGEGHRSLSTRAIGVLRGRMVVVLHNCILPGSALRFSPGKDEEGGRKGRGN